MSINNVNSLNLNFLDKLVDLIESFYDEKHISEDGVVFTFDNKTNINRVRFLLELFWLNDVNDLSLSDKKELLNLFSSDILLYLDGFVENIIDKKESISFKTFLLKILQKQKILRYSLQKSEMMDCIKDYLFSVFDKNELYDIIKNKSSLKNSLDLVYLKKIIEKSFFGKVEKIIGNPNSPVFLVKINDDTLCIIDVVNRKVLYDTFSSLEKGYSFSGNKVMIFQEPVYRKFDDFKKEMMYFDIMNNDSTLENFLDFLMQKYPTGAFSKAVLDDLRQKFNGISLSDLLGDDSLLDLIYTIFNDRKSLLPVKRKIILENTTGEMIDLGLRNSVGKPKKIENGYLKKDAIQIPVLDNENKKILITNDKNHDIFDLE